MQIWCLISSEEFEKESKTEKRIVKRSTNKINKNINKESMSELCGNVKNNIVRYSIKWQWHYMIKLWLVPTFTPGTKHEAYHVSSYRVNKSISQIMKKLNFFKHHIFKYHFIYFFMYHIPNSSVGELSKSVKQSIILAVKSMKNIYKAVS